MAKTDEDSNLRATLESALEARADELRANSGSLMPDIRRLLEVEAKLKPYHLDAHKGLVKELLAKVFVEDGSEEEEAEDEDMSGPAAEAEGIAAPKRSEGLEKPVEGGEEKVVARKEGGSSKRAPLSDKIVEAAALKRAAYVRENAQTLTMYGFRRMLEEDLKLPVNELDPYKRLIKQLVDEALAEEVSPVSATKKTKDGGAGTVKKKAKAEDFDVRPARGKKRAVEDVKGKAVKKPVKRGRVESSDEDEDERDQRRTAAPSKQGKGNARKRAVESDRSEDGSDGSDAEDTKENRQKRSKLAGDKGSSRSKNSAVHRESASGSEEDEGDERSAGKKNPKAKAKPKTIERDESEEGAESDGGSKRSQGRKAVYEQKPVYSKQVEHLRSVIKACGMNVSPSIYKKAKNAPDGKQEAVLVKELESMLEREGLTPQASEKEIKAVRKKKDKMKDLEGIDSSNIISEPRGRRSASASFFAPKYSPTRSEDEDDHDKDNGTENINDDEDADEDEDGADDGADGGSSMEDEEEGADEGADEDDEDEDEDEADADSDGKGGEESD